MKESENRLGTSHRIEPVIISDIRRESGVELQAMRDNTGKLLQELLAIRDSNHVMRRSIQ